MNYNKVILMGNLTRDPELRYSAQGTAIANLSLAVNRKWKAGSGEQQQETTFVEVTAFGRQAETLGQYMKKGNPLMIEGRLKLDQWEDKQTGQKRSKLGVVAEGFMFLNSGSDSGGRSEEPKVKREPQEQQSLPNEDDVPF